MRYAPTLLILLSAAACTPTKSEMRAPPAPIKAFPGDMLNGAVPVFPLNNMTVDSSITGAEFAAKRTAMNRVDSILNATLVHRYPTVHWVKPVDLQKAAAQAPGMLPDPYEVSTLPLQTHALSTIPAQTLTQLRGLVAVASGGRYVVVPANLFLTRIRGATQARIVVTLADVRMGAVSWSGTMTGVGDDPWAAITEAVVGITMIRDQ